MGFLMHVSYLGFIFTQAGSFIFYLGVMNELNIERLEASIVVYIYSCTLAIVLK